MQLSQPLGIIILTFFRANGLFHTLRSNVRKPMERKRRKCKAVGHSIFPSVFLVEVTGRNTAELSTNFDSYISLLIRFLLAI